MVAAVIVDSLRQPTRLLAAMRSYPQSLEGLYELPGGKVDRGEDPLDALKRELWEELSLSVHIGHPVPCPGADTSQTAIDPGFNPWPILSGRVMWVWLAEPRNPSEAITPGDSHSSLKWVTPDKALALPWIPTNQAIVSAVVELMGRDASSF